MQIRNNYDILWKNEAGTEAKYKRLRVHHGEVSIDNVDGFSLMNLGSR